MISRRLPPGMGVGDWAAGKLAMRGRATVMLGFGAWLLVGVSFDIFKHILWVLKSLLANTARDRS